MRRAIGTASFLVCLNIVSSVIVIPIIVEMKTGIDVFEGILQHALHAFADCVKQLTCLPSMLELTDYPSNSARVCIQKSVQRGQQ